MLNLPKDAKLQLFRLISAQLSKLEGSEIFALLERVWDLRLMPSDDQRFSDAQGDAIQHLINNDDWSFDIAFLDRFKLLDDNEAFNRFLNSVVSPDFTKSEDEIIKFILLIDPFTSKYNYSFALTDHSANGLPIYLLKEGTEFLFDLKPNTIPIFPVWDKIGRSDRRSGHHPPPQFPSFVLVFNDGWNDFSIRSQFYVFYYNKSGEISDIGSVKIISDSANNSIEGELPATFTQLDETFCSLGQTESYYQNLKRVLGQDYQSVLFALRDASLFPDNHERFERSEKFISSVIRFDEAERLLRTARYLTYGFDLQNLYNFTYNFQPKYSEENISIDFEFSKEELTGNRIYALIGKNGAGKTQLITSLPIAISKREDNSFIPRAPLFSKVIAVSYSVFDRFEIPRKSASFNYIYCGLRKDENEQLSEKGLVLRFYNSWKKLQTQGRLDGWKRILSNFVNAEEIDLFIIEGDTKAGEQEYKIDAQLFQDFKKKLSSGQSILFFIITEIISNIRFDSLLLYDEPETHLHPNAITELIYVIHELVTEFKSYCIIATHSPVIIRELFSRNVYVIDRVENIPSIRKISIESFGEDVGVLTDEVFGNKEVPKRYKKTIDELAFLNYSFDQIIEKLESDNIPLSLNTRLYIRSAVKLNNA